MKGSVEFSTPSNIYLGGATAAGRNFLGAA
jgi:hypothetical protein